MQEMSYSNTPKEMGSPRDPTVVYCCQHTIKLTPLQVELQTETFEKAPMGRMHGIPEVLTFGQHFIRNYSLKRVLDVGTFTGCSALAWALAVPEDGEVLTFDIDHTNFKKFGVPILQKDLKTFEKIHPVEGPAVESLDKLIADGQSGTFDFAFIDADKENYSEYYERAVILLRKGGIIFIDNSLLHNAAVNKSGAWGIAVDAMNDKIFKDDRTFSALLTLGDGTHIAFKK